MLNIIFRHIERGRVRLLVRENRFSERLSVPKAARFGCSGAWEMELDEDGVGMGAVPVFFAWQQLEVFFEPIEDHPYQAPFQLFLNRQPTEFRSFQGQGEKLLFGSLNLSNAVGYTDLEIRDSKGKTIWLFETEIFPTKLGYKRDFEEMVGELTDEVYNLAFDLLKKTFVRTKAVIADRPSGTEWLSIFETLFELLQKQLLNILNQPHSEVVSRGVVMPVAKVRRHHPNAIQWLRKNPFTLREAQKADQLHIRGHAPTRLLALQKQISYDTVENRFLVWMLKQLKLDLENTAIIIRKYSLGQKKKGADSSKIT